MAVAKKKLSWDLTVEAGVKKAHFPTFELHNLMVTYKLRSVMEDFLEEGRLGCVLVRVPLCVSVCVRVRVCV